MKGIKILKHTNVYKNMDNRTFWIDTNKIVCIQRISGVNQLEVSIGHHEIVLYFKSENELQIFLYQSGARINK